MNRAVAVKLLKKQGYEVVTAKDGQEALDKLSDCKIDFIFMDVQMPVMDGVTATKIIRTSSEFVAKSNIPIVAMTAHAMSGDKEAFLDAGMDDYISKPFDKETLFTVIQRVLSRKSN